MLSQSHLLSHTHAQTYILYGKVNYGAGWKYKQFNKETKAQADEMIKHHEARSPLVLPHLVDLYVPTTYIVNSTGSWEWCVMRPIHDQSCCAKQVCRFTIKSISTKHGQSCCTTRNVAQHDWSCMGPFTLRVSGLCPSSIFPKENVSESGSASVLRWKCGAAPNQFCPLDTH
jgi:hypothetical protein